MTIQNVKAVCMLDVLTGYKVNYSLKSVLADNTLTFEVFTLPYGRAERYRLFQSRNIAYSELAEEIDINNIENKQYINANYVKELI